MTYCESDSRVDISNKMEAEKPMDVVEDSSEVTMESLEVTSQPVEGVKATEALQPMLVDPNLPEGWKRCSSEDYMLYLSLFQMF